MPAPSPLQISTSSLLRLLNEESSYGTEVRDQEARLGKLQQQQRNNDGDDGDDGNLEYEIRQQKQAIEETKALFPQLKSRIEEAGRRLQALLDEIHAPAVGGGEQEEVTKAREALGKAKERRRERRSAGVGS
ncbi:MAG: hypothetical protein M1816_006399 [Peltula sp. TS41687]|nr:MAG: hypothetical protein M1816_006399 [Peltula sp. TS41687]